MVEHLRADEPVGVIGLGAIGRGVAGCLLQARYAVHGYDVAAVARDWLQDSGGQAASSAGEVAARVRVCLTIVVNDEQTEAVLFGPDGVATRMARGGIVIVCSTVSPAFAEDACRRLAQHGIHMLDAPVTGGAKGARAGTLTTMVGGDQQVCDAVRPLLQAYTSDIFHLGPSGRGARMKLVNQMLCGIHLAAVGEALALVRALGIPPEQALQLLTSGAASSWMLEDRGPRAIHEDFSNVTSAVDIFVKDMGLVTGLTNGLNYPAYLSHAAYLAFQRAAARGWGRHDDSAVIVPCLEDAGHGIGPPAANDS